MPENKIYKKPNENIEPTVTTISDLLLQAVQQYPHSGLRFISGDKANESTWVTYPDLIKEAQRVLGGLRAHAPKPDVHVILILEHAYDFVSAIWACILGGYVPCPVIPIRNDPERWEKHLNHVSSLLGNPLLISTKSLQRELVGLSDAIDVNKLRTAMPDDSIHQASIDDPAIFMLTSGSTGNSKAVVLTHGNLLSAMKGKNERQRLTAEDITLNWISFDHVAAFSEAHLLPLSVGAEQLHVPPETILAEPLLFLRLISDYRVAMTFTPNFLLGQINAALKSGRTVALELENKPFDLSCLRQIISGGEATVVETGRNFHHLLAPYGLANNVIWPGFGMTETCAGSIYSCEFPDIDANKEFGSLGFPILGLQMRVANEDGPLSQADEVGELQLYGPMIFTRYYNNEEATREAFTEDGWFRTGDLALIENGRLNLVGRNKDSIIVSGVNYFSHELETTLEQLSGIEKSFVAAFPIRSVGSDTEQLVVAFSASFPHSDDNKLYHLLTAIRNTTILLWGFRPTLILPLPQEAFQKTSLGKIQRAIMRKRLESGIFADEVRYIKEVSDKHTGGYIPPAGETEEIIANIYAELFSIETDQISATENFFDVGGTSLDIVRLKQAVQQQFNIKDVPIVTLIQNPTVRTLAARLASHDSGIYDPVVTLQATGNKTPVFCIHPGIGEILVFVNLAKYFINDRPFYALRARGLEEGEEHFTSFEELVNVYLEGIRSRQPHGPYAIAGYSYGSPVAFEIAKRLESQGERVAFVGSIDMAPLLMHQMAAVDEADIATTLAFFLSLVDKEEKDGLAAKIRAAAGNQEACEYLLKDVSSERLQELDLNLEKFKAWATLTQSLLNIGRSYVPTGNVESISVFYADPPRGSKEEWFTHLKCWDAFSRQTNNYIPVAGDHYDLMGPKNLATFQAILRNELDRKLGDK
ncbi:chrysobactin synthetase cbsF [Xenorhabdus stockiae]|uniref:Chrysobactin synthetase cbsF n=1 Tax=Xenorhabdus stockiae TaxID=351614 RepID=A0A2D0KPX9_9GAMM|nr:MULTISPECIES: non-ribosomal peptide synthetase [Xenorhabdus]PHM65448.1 chrysobactin synthetase cbsF [Xenorhabdus stockiae]PHM69679.1 chrysobactin synthetase cbsF [Xenorhabdus sp. KJ12.1]